MDLKGGEGEEPEHEALDLAGILVPSILASVLLLIFIILTICHCCRRHKCKGYPSISSSGLCGTNSSSQILGDVESLTDGIDNDGGLFYADDFTTITGLSDDPEYSSQQTLSSRSSIFSIVEDDNGGSGFGVTDRKRTGTPTSTVSRAVQTDPHPLQQVSYLKTGAFTPSWKNVYTISVQNEGLQRRQAGELDRDLDRTLAPAPGPGLLECFNDTCIVSVGGKYYLRENEENNGEWGQRHSSSENTASGFTSSRTAASLPVIHFDSFSKFAEYVSPRKKPLLILKPIVDNISTSSEYFDARSSSNSSFSGSNNESSQTTPSTSSSAANSSSSSSSKRRRKENHSSQELSMIEETDVPSPSSSPKKRSLTGLGIENDLIFEKDQLEELIKRGELCDLNLVEECRNSLNLIKTLRKSQFANKPDLPEGISLTEGEAENGIQFFQELQQSPIYNKKTSIQLAQQLILLHAPKLDLERQSDLVIGVDATPYYFGGYCVNLIERRIDFYIMMERDLPWAICDRQCSDEFEMKNFLFALSLWNDDIEKANSFSVFTDNNAILQSSMNRNRHNYGMYVNKLVEHFVKCRKATLANPNMYVNRKRDLESFAKHIQPADDLSRLEIDSCVEFLSNFYKIDRENVRGTHWTNQKYIGAKANSLDATPFYEEALQKVKTFVYSLDCEHRMNDALGINDLSFKVSAESFANLVPVSAFSTPISENSPGKPSKRRGKRRSKRKRADSNSN